MSWRDNPTEEEERPWKLFKPSWQDPVDDDSTRVPPSAPSWMDPEEPEDNIDDLLEEQKAFGVEFVEMLTYLNALKGLSAHDTCILAYLAWKAGTHCHRFQT